MTDIDKTPLTDEEVETAKKFPATKHGLWVSAEFARDLERRLNAARERSSEMSDIPEGWFLTKVLVRDGYGPSWRKLIRDHPGMLATAPQPPQANIVQVLPLTPQPETITTSTSAAPGTSNLAGTTTVHPVSNLAGTASNGTDDKNAPTRYGEVCQDGIACKKPGECKARGKCAVFGNAAPFNQAVAWLHKDHATAYVITGRVKDLWEKVDPKHVENYTIPLYQVQRVEAAFVSPSYEAAISQRSDKHAPTPRTDAAAILRDPPSPFQGQYVRVEFARQLERELAECRKLLEGEHDAHMECHRELAEAVKVRNEAIVENNAMRDRAEAAEADWQAAGRELAEAKRFIKELRCAKP